MSTTLAAPAGGIRLTGDDLDAAREFVNQAIVDAAVMTAGDCYPWQTPAGMTINFGKLTYLLSLVQAHEALDVFADGSHHWALTDDMVTAIREAARFSMERADECDHDEGPWSNECARNARLARRVMGALEHAS